MPALCDYVLDIYIIIIYNVEINKKALHNYRKIKKKLHILPLVPKRRTEQRRYTSIYLQDINMACLYVWKYLFMLKTISHAENCKWIWTFKHGGAFSLNQ